MNIFVYKNIVLFFDIFFDGISTCLLHVKWLIISVEFKLSPKKTPQKGAILSNFTLFS